MPADPIRLLAVRTRYPHWGKYAGLHAFLRHLEPSRFHTTELVTNDGDADFPRSLSLLRAPLRMALRRWGMAWYGLSDLAMEARIGMSVGRRRADLVHYLDGEHTALFCPGRGWNLGPRRVRYLATYHQPPDLLTSLVGSAVLRRLDAVTVVSPTQLEFFRPFVSPDRLFFVPHGVDTAFFHPGTAPRAPGPFRCLTVGHHLRDYAALKRVAEYFLDDPDVRFDVVTARETGLDRLPNVARHRSVGDPELLALYQHADVLLLPLSDATANNSLLEGIACGLPVISTDLEAVRTYVPGNEAILVPANDVDGLIAAVTLLRDSEPLRTTASRSARRRAEELDWTCVAPVYAMRYEAICG